MISRNAYYLLRRLIHDYKVDPHRGIKEWQWRINQLNSYIKFMPSKALEKRDGVKEEFTELDLREILDMAMPHSYRKKLTGNDWNIYEQPFMKTIGKLITFEPDIKAEATKAKSDKELADKVYGNKGTKRNNNGTKRVSDAKKTTCTTCNK